MDIVLSLLSFAVFWETCHAILCYRCLPERVYDDKKTPLCETFDWSDKFVIDCPLSTGCVKKSTQLLSLGVTTQSVERDCAHQTMDGYQEKDASGQWRMVNKIHEVYQEGCNEDPNEYDKPTKATQCFCRGDLCNSAHTWTRSGLPFVVIPALWMVFY